MKEKLKRFMDEPLTIRRELKINLIAAGILMIPSAIIMVYGLYQSNKAIDDFNEDIDAKIEKMRHKVYLPR